MEHEQNKESSDSVAPKALTVRSSACRSYRGVAAAFGAYWKDYGGFDALIGSAYFHVAASGSLAITYFASGYEWWSSAISIVPSMLGFSLAGYAIVMAIGAGEFQELIARAGNRENSVMRRMSAAYVHFLVVQALALILAVVADALHANALTQIDQAFQALIKYPALQYILAFFSIVVQWVGGLTVLYPITTAVGATLFVFDLIKLYVEYAHRSKEKRDRETSGNLRP